MRTGVTLADITRAADQLLAEGERPTVDGVRRVLGTGSPATVNNLLKEYYQSLPSRLNLPASITSAVAALYQQIREAAAAEAQADANKQLQEVDAQRERLDQDRRTFQEERARLVQQVAALEAENHANHGAQTQQAQRIQSLERSLAEQTERAVGAESKANAAIEERDRATQRQVQELQRLREQTEGNERHLLSRIEDLQQQLKRLTADREKEGTAALQRNAMLETVVSEANKSLAALRTELAAAQREATQERAARHERDRLHALELDRVAKEGQVIAAERDQLRSAASQTEAQLKRLAQERDEALREAARQEGKLQSQATRIEELRDELAQLRKPAATGKRPEAL